MNEISTLSCDHDIKCKSLSNNSDLSLKKSITALFLAAITLSFIPLRQIPLLPVAPVNIVYYLFIVYCLFNVKDLQKLLTRPIILLLSFFLLYAFLDFFLRSYKGELPVNVFTCIRRTLLVIMIVVLAHKRKGFTFAYKAILLIITFNVLFGFLIHLFGEPFASIREGILAFDEISADPDRLLGSGERIAGMSASIFQFGYIMTPAPIMALGLYLAERRLRWVLVLILCLFGVIFNAERSAALMASIGCLLLLYLATKRKLISCLLLIFLFSMIAFLTLVFSPPASPDLTTKEMNLLHRLQADSNEQSDMRIEQMLAGLQTIRRHYLIGGTYRDYQQELFSLLFLSTPPDDNVKEKISFPYYLRYPASHNHYINIGVHTGLLGLFVFFAFLYYLVKIEKLFGKKTLSYPAARCFYLSVSISLLAIFGNALFHNTGVFFAEITTWVLIGLLCAGSTLELDDSTMTVDSSSG